MLKIGGCLREARVRRGVELAQVDADTYIRTRYLLPGAAYARGLLRTYTDYPNSTLTSLSTSRTRFAPPERV